MNKFEHGGNIYNDNGLAESWLDMSANINPLGMSSAVKSAIINNIEGLVHYPDPTARELKSAISYRYKISLENIITLNGAAEFFYLFFNTIKPKRVLIIVPSFSDYERAARSAGCDVVYFFVRAEDNFKVDLDRLIKIIKNENIDCVILGSPNNPTSNFLLSISDIIQLTKFVEYVVIDESFIDFIYADVSVRQLIGTYPNLITVQSMTKFYALPGLRLGFAVADKSLIERLENCKDVWNVNYLAQKAGVAALNDEEFFNKTCSWINLERPYVTERLQRIKNIKIFNPAVNFVLIKIKDCQTANELLNKMRQHKILLRSCANFAGLDASYIRMAIRSRTDNDCVINLWIDLMDKIK
ncbi:MAG: aminotransferase class I/II-fold pyridoxal phosphate-dependent enzyme [Selenomonadaceae bacterium]|nr:aminotransferase class I/II-fold pyridoxal phosphate-dependent enzyme [Selenomonadaceae bacterium]